MHLRVGRDLGAVADNEIFDDELRRRRANLHGYLGGALGQRICHRDALRALGVGIVGDDLVVVVVTEVADDDEGDDPREKEPADAEDPTLPAGPPPHRFFVGRPLLAIGGLAFPVP